MKLVVCDVSRIKIYPLPTSMEDIYIIEDTFGINQIKESIFLEPSDNKWSIKSDESIQLISNNQVLTRAALTEYVSYDLKFSDLSIPLSIYLVPDLEEYTSCNVESSITIGNSNTDKIVYNKAGVGPSDVTINNNIITTQTDMLYVNSQKVKAKALNLGDVIFFNGLKIIWMGAYLKINNPNSQVILNLTNHTETKIKNEYTPTTEAEKKIILYNDNQVFFHTPRIKSEIKEEKIKIDAPPTEERDEQMPMFLTVGTSAIIGLTSCVTGVSAVHGLLTGTTDKFNAYMQLIICFLMLIACIGFPMLVALWQKNRIKKKERLRQKRYTQYLDKKEIAIEEIMKKQEAILYQNNLSLKEIIASITNKDTNIWSREILDNDFLTIRLGLGEQPCKINVSVIEDAFSLYDDNLRDNAVNMTNMKRMIKNVPIAISLVENRVTPFIINCNFKQNYIDSLLLQLIYYYSGADLKIVVFTNETNAANWDYLKYMPHNWNEDLDIRFFATNEAEKVQVSMYLEKEYKKRLEHDEEHQQQDAADYDDSPYKTFDTYYLIITDDVKTIKDVPIFDRIMNSAKNFGFSIMLFETLLKNLPSRFKKFVSISPNSSGIFDRTLDIDSQVQFKPEYLENINITDFSKILANIPLFSKTQTKQIPSSISFLDMYKVGKVEQLNIVNRWHDNDTTMSLRAPVGIKEYEKIVELDLHEKFHGPHGLIAGMTGSGKSEFIITYILSMAINYDPREVQFVLIDYKGGGLAGAFENREANIKIPHLVGTITNLDVSEMHRTLVSIKSELKRRQVAFNNARNLLGEGTIDIYKYQRLYREGKVKDPISHLFVIADEFAELKDQQPDFMDELISTARIGRSLGVHLILATQKPTGVVNDQIWSNSKFHICLKVQTNEDSIEMLKKNDAANIKETGRFYLQVGNDEIFELAQSAWAGAKYIPANRMVKKIDDSLEFISNDGMTIKKTNDELKPSEIVELGEQLTNIVKYLYHVAKRENIPFSSLWLPSMPNDIYVGNLVAKYQFKPKFLPMEIPVGEYDKPAKQEQGLYTIDLTCKNTIIYGSPGSGKENLLTTLIFTACLYHNPRNLQFYILDFGSESLRVFNKMPHVGDVIFVDESDKINTYFNFIEKEVKKRKELFAEYSGDFQSYCKSSGKTVPLIVSVINGFESFGEHYGGLEYDFSRIIRESSKYGIVFVTTAVSTNALRASLLDCFNNKILLQVTEAFDYRYILNAAPGFMPKKVFGRGAAIVNEEACEIQTAYIGAKDNINNLIRTYSKTLFEKTNYKAKEIKVLPRVVTLKHLLKKPKTIDKIPLGFSIDDGDVVYYNFIKRQFNLVLGKRVIEDVNVMCGLIDLFDAAKNIKINILDFLSCIQTDGEVNYYNVDFKAALSDIMNSKEPTINFLIGLGNYKKTMSLEERKMLDNIMNSPAQYPNQFFIIVDNVDRFKNLQHENWYANIPKNIGLWCGDDIDEQDVLITEDLKAYDIQDVNKDTIYVIENSQYQLVKGIGNDGGML